MKKGQEYETVITGYDFPNKGIAYMDDRKVTIKGAFLGQKVLFRVTKMKSGMAEGRLLQVLEKSQDETRVPECTLFGACGGCLYQTYPYEVQLKIKEDQVRSLLDSVCSNSISQEYSWEGILKSPVEFGYRNKMEFSFGDEYKDGPLALGLHKKGSFYDIVTVSDCKIADSDYARILEATLAHFKERNIPYYKKMAHEGSLRHLVIRQTAKSKELLVNLVVSSQIQVENCQFRTEGSQFLEENRQLQAESSQILEENRQFQAENSQFLEENRQFQAESSQFLEANGQFQAENSQLQIEKTEEEGKQQGMKSGCLDSMKDYLDLDAWIHTLTTLSLHGKIAGILLTINDSLADVVQTDEMHVLYGRDYIVEELLGLKFKITPFSFFQTNSLGAEVLYGKAREYVGDTKDQVVFDLYSGTGTIAQMLAPVARKVVGVEIVEEAVEAAKNNAAYNGLSNCEFVAGDVLKVIDTLEDQPDLIVLDPPRDGIHPKALPKIINYGVQRIVYISCKPTSLTRDLVTLQAAGYRVEKACCVDMFPQTANVETVCLLGRRKPDDTIKVSVNMDDYYQIRDAEEAEKNPS